MFFHPALFFSFFPPFFIILTLVFIFVHPFGYYSALGFSPLPNPGFYSALAVHFFTLTSGGKMSSIKRVQEFLKHQHVVKALSDPMVCLFLLHVIAKVTTDCLIIIDYRKNFFKSNWLLQKLSRRAKWSTPLDWGGPGESGGA